MNHEHGYDVHNMSTKPFVLLSFSLCAALTACGGGGSATPATSNNTGVTTPTTNTTVSLVDLPPQTSVPAPTYTESHKLSAFNRINEVRAQLGLGLLAQNAKIDVAAQAHSDYQTTNARYVHSEVSTLPGFTGVNSVARLLTAGYSADTAYEVIDFDGTTNGAASIDGFLATAYHRLALMLYRPAEVGLGYSVQTSSTFAVKPIALTVDLAYNATKRQGAPSVPFVVWPQPNAQAPAAMAPETPNPVSTQDSTVTPYGQPVSLVVDEAKTLTVNTFELRDRAGNLIPAYLLSYATDRNLQTMGTKFAALLVPKSPLTVGQTYTASFAGSAAAASAAASAVNVSWSFGAR